MDVAMSEVDDVTSISTDCLTEQPSSSDEDNFTWESLAPVKCPKTFVERGFASELEEWNFYKDLAKHFEEGDEDVASQPKWASRAKLSWRKTKTGRHAEPAHCLMVVPSSLAPCELFWEGPCGQNRGRVFGVPRIAFTGWDFTEDREHAVGAPGCLRDWEVDFEPTLFGDGFSKDQEAVFEPMMFGDGASEAPKVG
eukprot:4122181-Amphidinium_carterae.1